MTIRLSFATVSFCALLVTAPAHAQASLPSSAGDDAAAEQPLAPPPPAGRSDDILDGIAVDFAISDDDPEASIEVGNSFMLPVGRNAGGNRSLAAVGGNGPRGRALLNANWNVKLTVPLGGGDDLTSSSTLFGLLNGPKLTVNVGLFGFRVADLQTRRFREIMVQAAGRCRDAATTEAERANCTDRPDPEFAIRHSGLPEAEINRSMFSWMWRVGFEGSISANQYDHVEAVTLVKREDTHMTYSAALVAGFYPPDGMSAILLRGGYERGYESEDKRIICRPVVVDPANDCVTGIPAPAERTEALNFSLEYRRVFDTGWRAGSLAISPSFAIDALSGEFKAELPVYFIPRDSDFPISPGIRIGYSSEKDEVTFGLFLRTTFKL
jgi:hypothetical protein